MLSKVQGRPSKGTLLIGMLLVLALIVGGCAPVSLSLIHISEPTRPY